jgi:hypothetical protein
MADYNSVPGQFDSSSNRRVTEYEEKVVTETLQEFSQMQLWRNTTAGHWEEIAELILPSSRNTFFYGNFNWPGQKKTDRQVDASGMLALHRFAAILDSLLTPRNMIWHQLGPDADYLMKDRNVRLWYEAATAALFKARYSSIANFSSQNQQIYQSLGAFGTGAMFVDQAVNSWNVPIPALRYRACPIGEMFIHENHQGQVDGFIRWFRLTARQAYQKWGDGMPATLKAAMDAKSQMTYNFLHHVCPRSDYDPYRLDLKGKPFRSVYVSIEGRCLLEEGSYRMMPTAISRYDQTPGEVYGRSPAMMVLPALKTLNAEKTTFLKQGHRAADPVLLIADDGLTDFNMRPGAKNVGGWSTDGKPLVGILPTGDIQISKEMMADEKGLINDAFLVTLFQILTESPQMTATEVVERTNEKGILIAPTVGRQQSEYLGCMIPREIDLLESFGGLPPKPPVLKEANVLQHNVIYTSPLSRAQRAQEIAGFQRTLQVTLEVVNATQDPSPLDNFDLDVATIETAQIQAVPERWMASPEMVRQKRAGRAQAAKQQQQIQAMPAQAAMMKAQAVQAKAGQGNAVSQAREMVPGAGGMGAPGGMGGQPPQGMPQGPGQ